MTNGLISAVFTTGILKLIRLSDFTVIQEIDLLEESKDCKKVVDARLASHTCLSIINQNSINKTIRFCASFAVESKSGKMWRVMTFDFTFQQVKFEQEDWGQAGESKYDLSQALLACVCTGSKTLKDASVTELTFN